MEVKIRVQPAIQLPVNIQPPQIRLSPTPVTPATAPITISLPNDNKKESPTPTIPIKINTTVKSEEKETNEYKIVNPNFWKYAKGGELEMGIKTEMEEHGMSKANATKTAKDHLRENPKYYSIMKKVGLEEGGQLTLFATGGATFDDKVRAIKRNLVGKKVPSKYQGEYGKRYDKDEAEESAKRIAGAMVKK
jgi:hypothetical protein